MVKIMDRRQKKTREAIFSAFIELVSHKHYSQITVGEIINLANVGRATFYAHFETKDYLLKELCEELFCHIFDAKKDANGKHKHIFSCTQSPASSFLHLLLHLKNNDNNVLKLLSCPNNELFLDYFQSSLLSLITNETQLLERKKPNLPDAFYLNFVCSTFVQTVKWWVYGGLVQAPETIVEYFYSLI